MWDLLQKQLRDTEICFIPINDKDCPYSCRDLCSLKPYASCMRLSKKAIDEFKQIFQREFKVELSDEEANEKGLELLEFFRLIYKPIPKDFAKSNVNDVVQNESKI